MHFKKISELELNDRFYFLDDRHKKVWILEWIEDEDKIDIFGKKYIRKKYHLINDNKEKKEVKIDRTIVFTRKS